MAYYTLLVKYEKDDAWQIHFGDARLEVVHDEIKSIILDSDIYETKVVRTKTNSQQEINLAVKLINDAEAGVLPETPRSYLPPYLQPKDMVYLLGIMSAVVRAGDIPDVHSNGDCVTIATDLLDIVVAKVNRSCGFQP